MLRKRMAVCLLLSLFFKQKYKNKDNFCGGINDMITVYLQNKFSGIVKAARLQALSDKIIRSIASHNPIFKALPGFVTLNLLSYQILAARKKGEKLSVKALPAAVIMWKLSIAGWFVDAKGVVAVIRRPFDYRTHRLIQC